MKGDIKKVMRARRVSARRLAESLDVSVATISSRLNDQGAFKVSEVEQIAKAMEVDPTDLFDYMLFGGELPGISVQFRSEPQSDNEACAVRRHRGEIGL